MLVGKQPSCHESPIADRSFQLAPLLALNDAHLGRRQLVPDGWLSGRRIANMSSITDSATVTSASTQAPCARDGDAGDEGVTWRSGRIIL